MSEEEIQAPEGQPEEVQAPEGQPVQEEDPFYSFDYTDETGTTNPQVFKSRDELDSFLKNSSMMRSDYTRKTQTLAEERKKFENDRKMYMDWYDQQKELSKKYESFDKLLKNRPDVYRELQQKIARGPSTETNYEVFKERFEKEYGEDFKQFKDFMKQQQLDSQRSQVFNELKEAYPDFDEKSISEAVGQLGQGGMKGLAETIYFAQKGRKTPLEVEKKLTEDMVKKKSAGLIRSGAGAPSTVGQTPRSLEEAAKQAYEEELGG